MNDSETKSGKSGQGDKKQKTCATDSKSTGTPKAATDTRKETKASQMIFSTPTKADDGDATEDEDDVDPKKSVEKKRVSSNGVSNGSVRRSLTSPSQPNSREPHLLGKETTYDDLLEQLRALSESMPVIVSDAPLEEGRKRKQRTTISPELKKLLSLILQKKAAEDNPCQIGEGIVSQEGQRAVSQDLRVSIRLRNFWTYYGMNSI